MTDKPSNISYYSFEIDGELKNYQIEPQSFDRISDIASNEFDEMCQQNGIGHNDTWSAWVVEVGFDEEGEEVWRGKRFEIECEGYHGDRIEHGTW